MLAVVAMAIADPIACFCSTEVQCCRSCFLLMILQELSIAAGEETPVLSPLCNFLKSDGE